MLTTKKYLADIIEKYRLLLYDEYYQQDDDIFEINCKMSSKEKLEELTRNDFAILAERVKIIVVSTPDLSTSKTIRLPKTLHITLEWIENKMGKVSKNPKIATNIFREFLQSMNINPRICATTFGFSKFIALRSEKSDEEVVKFTEILKENGIEFTTRFSTASWCYNWVVSKKKHNLEKLTRRISF